MSSCRAAFKGNPRSDFFALYKSMCIYCIYMRFAYIFTRVSASTPQTASSSPTDGVCETRFLASECFVHANMMWKRVSDWLRGQQMSVIFNEVRSARQAGGL